MKGFGRHRARAAATLARVATEEAAAAEEAGGEGGDGGDFADVGAALFASIRAVLSGGDDGDDGCALFETLAPALRRMLDAGDAMLDASDRALAEAMLRDGDGGVASPPGKSLPGKSLPGASPATPPSTSGKKKKRSMFSYAYGGVRKHALGLPSRDPEKRAAAAGAAVRVAGGSVTAVTGWTEAGGSPAVPTVSIEQLLG